MEVFEPALLSAPELQFMLDHLGEETVVALHDIKPETGINPREIKRWLVRFHELDSLARHRDRQWAGYDAIKDSIARYLDWQARCQVIREEGGPRHPSMYNWTPEGDVYRGGPGADAPDMVRHEILDDGTRRPFTVILRATAPRTAGTSLMPWAKIKAPVDSARDVITHNVGAGTITCGICQHSVSYDKKKGKAALNMAHGRMQGHLKRAKDQIERHRVLYRRKYRAAAEGV